MLAISIFLKEAFKEMKASLGEQDRYYFVDATHPNPPPVIRYQWVLKGQRPQVLSNSGRQRLNILGASSPCERNQVGFESTEKHQPSGRIILICDNARLFKAYLTQTHS
jgi:hypothetical protein